MELQCRRGYGSCMVGMAGGDGWKGRTGAAACAGGCLDGTSIMGAATDMSHHCSQIEHGGLFLEGHHGHREDSILVVGGAMAGLTGRCDGMDEKLVGIRIEKSEAARGENGAGDGMTPDEGLHVH